MDPGVGAIASAALAVVGALIVIAVHHLGYREFRRSRKMLAGALAACGIQALAFLLAGNVLAPVLAHIVLHGQLTLRGDEMPPSRASQGSGRAVRITPAKDSLAGRSSSHDAGFGRPTSPLRRAEQRARGRPRGAGRSGAVRLEE